MRGSDYASQVALKKQKGYDSMTLDEYYQSCGISKGEPRKRTKARKKRVHRGDVAEVRVYVFGREREICRCCRFRVAESMHELRFKSLGGKVSRRNSVAVCGSGTTGCHGYLQEHDIDWDEMDENRRAEATLHFIPVTEYAAEWLRIKLGESIESPVMFEMETAD